MRLGEGYPGGGSSHVHPAIHIQRMPGDIGRLFRGQKCNGMGNVGLSPNAAQRDVLQVRLLLLA